MDDLAAFISARLSEDEAMAKAAQPGPWSIETARVLREVTAKRDVLVIHHLQIIRQEATPFNPYTGEPNEPAYDGNCETCGWFSPGHGGCPTLRAIAAVWSDHPDYRPEWAPGHG